MHLVFIVFNAHIGVTFPAHQPHTSTIILYVLTAIVFKVTAWSWIWWTFSLPHQCLSTQVQAPAWCALHLQQWIHVHSGKCTHSSQTFGNVATSATQALHCLKSKNKMSWIRRWTGKRSWEVLMWWMISTFNVPIRGPGSLAFQRYVCPNTVHLRFATLETPVHEDG